MHVCVFHPLPSPLKLLFVDALANLTSNSAAVFKNKCLACSSLGELADVVLGYDELASYELNPAYFGCIVGRCANRISNASISVDGKSFQLEANAGKNMLHGGPVGFNKRVWSIQSTSATNDTASISLQLTSSDGGM
jgi:galactose mutarotase-like enzyme